MNKRGFRQLSDCDDIDEFEEYTLNVDKDIERIRFKEKANKWDKKQIFTVLLGIVVISALIYFLGSWAAVKFNQMMTGFQKYLEEHPVKGVLSYMLLFIIK